MPSSVLRNVEFFSDYTDLEDVVFGSSGGSEFLCETPTEIHQLKVKNQTKNREREREHLPVQENDYTIWCYRGVWNRRTDSLAVTAVCKMAKRAICHKSDEFESCFNCSNPS